VAIFEDDPGAEWVRTNHAQERFDYRARHRERIVIAGVSRALYDRGQP